MKKQIIVSLLVMSIVMLSSCSDSEGPLTEVEQAQKYGFTINEYKEQKDAAARMNMTIEDHLKMSNPGEEMDHSQMNMGDDSDMIEDDSEKSTHIMDDGKVMTDEDMHMEMMHESDDIESHEAGSHGDHE